MARQGEQSGSAEQKPAQTKRQRPRSQTRAVTPCAGAGPRTAPSLLCCSAGTAGVPGVPPGDAGLTPTRAPFLRPRTGSDCSGVSPATTPWGCCSQRLCREDFQQGCWGFTGFEKGARFPEAAPEQDTSWQCCCVSLETSRASVSPPEVLLCTCTGAFIQSGCAQCPGQSWCGQTSLPGTQHPAGHTAPCWPSWSKEGS